MGHLFLGVENRVGKTHLRKLGNLRENMHGIPWLTVKLSVNVSGLHVLLT